MTAYCPCTKCCGPNASGVTSTGLKCAEHPRGIAVDPRCIPYGTQINVHGYGTAKADDTGAAMRRDWRNKSIVHVDIRMTTHAAAKAWGVHQMYIEVIDP